MSFFNGFLQSFVSGLGTGDTLRDYQHAAKTFVNGLYRLSPKYTSLFHVYLDLNPNITQVDQNSQVEIGLMAKTAQLPKFSVQTKTYNAYNRKNINQERIMYDPINLTFHDDSSDVVRNFWYDYYSYYYRDSDHQAPLYSQESKYKERQAFNWGFTPRGQPNGTPSYLSAIRIYSLHQASFSSYILFNPTITSFSHGDHEQGANAVMEHSMQIEYTSVQYEYGPVSAGTVQGFNVVHYDNYPSPLSAAGGGTRSFLGKGGLVEGVGSIITNLGEGNLGAAALVGLRQYNNFRNANLKDVAAAEALQIGKNILRGQNNNSTVFFPTAQSIGQALNSTNAVPGSNGPASANATGLNRNR